jgi:hypothetical protein
MMIPVPRWWLAALAAALLAGCVTQAPRPAAEPPELRAAQRWEALIGRDAATAYGFFTPAYRSVNGLDAYEVQVQKARTDWTAAEVTATECPEPDRCVVRVKVDFELRGLLPGVARHAATQAVDETWLKVDGRWYFLPAR